LPLQSPATGKVPEAREADSSTGAASFDAVGHASGAGNDCSTGAAAGPDDTAAPSDRQPGSRFDLTDCRTPQFVQLGALFAPKGFFHVFNEAHTVVYELIMAGADIGERTWSMSPSANIGQSIEQITI
jgi:hypothetical protein